MGVAPLLRLLLGPPLSLGGPAARARAAPGSQIACASLRPGAPTSKNFGGNFQSAYCEACFMSPQFGEGSREVAWGNMFERDTG